MAARITKHQIREFIGTTYAEHEIYKDPNLPPHETRRCKSSGSLSSPVRIILLTLSSPVRCINERLPRLLISSIQLIDVAAFVELFQER